MSSRRRGNSRSPIREKEREINRSRENWRPRQDRSRDQHRGRPYYRQRHRDSWGGRERGNYRRHSEGSNNYRHHNKHFDETNNNDRNTLVSDREESGRAKLHTRRRSLEDKEPRPLVLNPTDVPRAERYFDHDNRLGGGGGGGGNTSSNATPSSSSRRPRIDSTPAKWGHDMFEKITAEDEGEEEDEEDTTRQRTKSVVVSKIVIPHSIADDKTEVERGQKREKDQTANNEDNVTVEI